jgi:M6 family metalloprotease-like protein
MRKILCGLAIVMVTLPLAASETVEGIVSVVWGDPPPGGGVEPEPLIDVTTSDGTVVRLAIDAALFEYAVAMGSGTTVRVSGDLTPAGSLRVDSLVRLGSRAGERALTGAQPWVSLMCKFSGTSAEPRSLGYFISMFDNTPGRLDHYWREVSYDNITVAGSTAVGWVTLPKTRTDYANNNWNLSELFDDCTAAADHLVDFSDAGGGSSFVGINLMFNDNLDGYAWGGSRWATLDGVSKSWRTTWEPPWGYQNVCVMAHEMGHGFGLPHSNNWDGDSSPYDNVWDVMSDTWSYAASDATYGTIGKHTIGYHKYDRMGWIPSAKVYQPAPDSAAWVEIDDLALASVANYRMAKLPIPGTDDHYTVEVRGKTGHYDARLPSKAVIIHHVDTARREDAWAVDIAVPPGNNSAGEGTMWRVGETFEDPGAQIAVLVDSQTANGFRLRILYGDASDIFGDGFENNTYLNWSGAFP